MPQDPITWERLRAIFGNPSPVLNVTQQQFDYADEKLQQMGRTPYDQIDFHDLWFYHHDLAYVDLQPDLFNYLFPICLMDWHRSLLANEACSHGDTDFHNGIVKGAVLTKMLTETRRTEVERVFHDSMLYRMDLEPGLQHPEIYKTAGGWISRLNSLGFILKSLPDIWNKWWEVETTGRAVCVLQYCSGLMHFDGENPIFESFTDEDMSHHAFLCSNDTFLLDTGWPPENVRFLRSYLTPQRVFDAVIRAAKRLKEHPDIHIAAKMVAELDLRHELIESRVSELPNLLAIAYPDGWSV